jgi:serine/threonine protein kinase
MTLADAGYHVLGPIARGGMAEVVLAERIGPGGVRKRLAIKRLLPELASEPGFITLLENEARVAVELDHANIVSVFELGEADGELFLAMEFVRGWNLTTVLDGCAKRGARMPPELAIHVAHEVCRALAYAHTKTDDRGAPLGIVHRDVSPSNVLLSADGAVKLTDFGIARAAAVAQTTQGMWLRGKVPYASPEQVAGKTLDPSSDLYSLAVLLFEMLTGKRLFSTDVASAERERAAPLPRVAELVPRARDLQPVLDRALAFAKKDRFASAMEMVEALSHVAERRPSRPTAADVAVYLAALALPPPVSPENVDEGELTEIVALDPMVASPNDGQAEDPRGLDERAPDAGSALNANARSSRWWMVFVAAGVFSTAMVATKMILSARSRQTTRLEIRTTTPGVNVWIDGAHHGVTPVIARDLSRGAHRVVVGSPDAATTHDVDLLTVPNQTLDLDVR